MPVNFEYIRNSYKRTAFKALTTPLFVALILTLPILFFMPKTEKYQVSTEGQPRAVAFSDSHIKHHDLNNDGETETIFFGNNQRGDHSIIILHPEGKVFNQWRFRGMAPKYGESFFIGDANGNGFSEVYVFSQVEDSIFLNFFEPYNPDGVRVENIFIDTVIKIDGEVDFMISSIQLCWLNSSNGKYLFFSIGAGFSIQPRNVYRFNPMTHTLKKSPTSGAPVEVNNYPRLNNPGDVLFLSRNYAPGNMRSHMQIPFSDNSAWVMVFDQDLDFLFPPIEFPGFTREVSTYPFYLEDDLRILAFSSSNVRCDTCQILVVYDLAGKEIMRQELFDHPDGRLVLLYDLAAHGHPPILFSPETGNLFEVTKSLELMFRGKIPTLGQLTSFGNILDFDNDGKADYFVIRFSNGIVVLDYNLKPVATHNIENLSDAFDYTLGVKRRIGQTEKQFSFQAGSNLLIFSLAPNPLHHLKWLILLAYYFAATATVYISQRIYQSRASRNQRLEKELLSLQAQLATNQLDPHFVSNALNSINAFVLLNKNIDALEYLLKFSKLVEETLSSSDHISRTLEAELSFVGNFLDLEKKRKANFDYSVNIGANVDKKTLVPKMAIHIFAENSVKHGFISSGNGGLLVIDVSQKQGLLEIIINDNGIGFKKAAEYSEYSSRKGLVTISKIFDLHQKLFNRAISCSITSLTPENDDQTGTEVRITLEVKGDG